MSGPSPLHDRLRAALASAMKERDRASISVLRSTLAAVDNAGAVEALDAEAADSQVVAGAVSGIGAAEATRRALGDADIEVIVAAEVAEQLEAADTYERAGQQERAAALRSGAAVLTALLDDPTPSRG